MRFKAWLEETNEGIFDLIKRQKTNTAFGKPIHLGSGDPKRPASSYSSGRGTMRRKLINKYLAKRTEA